MSQPFAPARPKTKEDDAQLSLSRESVGRTGARQVFLIGAAVFALGLVVRIALLLVTRSYESVEYSEVVNVAIALATKGTFADAYGSGTGPTAHAAPLYPLMLSGVYRVFGTPPAGAVAQEVFSSLLSALHYALLPAIAAVCGLGLRVGAVAGLLAALLPVNRWVQTKGSFEYSLAALLVALLSLAILRTWRDTAFHRTNGVVVGLMSGVTLLAAPQVAPLLAALAVAGWLRNRSGRTREYLAFVVVQFAVAAVCVAPWTIRNAIVLGSPVWGRSNLGLELNLSNNDDAFAEWDDNMAAGLFGRAHPHASAAERARVMAVGEIAYNREKAARARQWILSHPTRFAALTLHRVWHFWFPTGKRWPQTLALAALTLGAWIGLGVAVAQRQDLAAWFFLPAWIAFPAPAYLFQQSARMRYPIEWMLFLLAACLSCAVWRRARLSFGGQRRDTGLPGGAE